LMTPTWAKPRAAPPPNASAMRSGRGGGAAITTGGGATGGGGGTEDGIGDESAGGALGALSSWVLGAGRTRVQASCAAPKMRTIVRSARCAGEDLLHIVVILMIRRGTVAGTSVSERVPVGWVTSERLELRRVSCSCCAGAARGSGPA
jgi:hypothetical protein